MGEQNIFRRFWNFLKADSWSSFVVTIILAFIIIKFIFFPLLSLLTGTSLPLVIVESCSMYHSEKFSGIFNEPATCDGNSCLEKDIYSKFNITLNDAEKWNFIDGLNKGDIIFVVSAKNIKQGDVIIFNANTQNPIIHRVINAGETLTTKGDNNKGLLDAEKNIDRSQVVGKAIFKIPLLGWAKLIFYDFSKPDNERGFCS